MLRIKRKLRRKSLNTGGYLEFKVVREKKKAIDNYRYNGIEDRIIIAIAMLLLKKTKPKPKTTFHCLPTSLR